MICNTIGLTTDSFETLYVHGGAEVPEVYGGINYAQPIFYSLKTLTGATSYSFMGYPERLKSCEISGNTVRNGTPTPTSPIYPQECGDRTENLFDGQLQQGFYAYLTGAYTLADTYVCTHLIPCTDNTTYTFRCVNTGGGSKNYGFVFFDSLQNRIGSDYIDVLTEGDVVTHTATAPPNTAFLAINVAYGRRQASVVRPSDITDFMLNTGSTVLPYEPYGYKIPLNLNGTTQNLYLAEPLRKIGDYADSINGDGAVERKIKKLALTGEEDWVYSSSGGKKRVFTYVLDKALTSIAECSHFVVSETYESYPDSGVFVINYSSATQTMLFGVTDMPIASESDFKSYLAAQYANGTPVTVWYVLMVPTTEQVTAPTLTPATGNNTLAIGTTLQPNSVSITGHIKPTSS